MNIAQKLEVQSPSQPFESMQYVLWEPELLGEKLAVAIETIKSHKISPDGKSKVQIQLLIKDGNALVSTFTV